MEKMIEGLEKLLKDPKTSKDTKEAIEKMIADEQARTERLAKEMDRILKR